MITYSRRVLITGSTSKAVRVGERTWIPRSEIVEMRELDEPSERVPGPIRYVGTPHLLKITQKAALRAGW
jgi:hypothetical protein